MERKKFLAVVVTVMMIISMVPSMVFAAAPSGELGGKLKIKGLAAVGVVVSADYAKVTPEEVTDEDFTFSWSRQTGHEVGRIPHLIPLRRDMASWTSIPSTSRATPWVLPEQPPTNSTDLIILFSTSKLITWDQVPCVLYVFIDTS